MGWEPRTLLPRWGPPSFQDQTLPRTLGQEGERWRTKVTEWGRERDKDRKEAKIAGIVET